MSNNVRHINFASRPAEDRASAEPEPTELQRAVLVRARELRERESQPRKRSPAQWVAAGVMAIVCFGLMYGAVDVVLRKFQQLANDFSSQPAATQPLSEPAPPPQATDPKQPFFVEVEPPGQP